LATAAPPGARRRPEIVPERQRLRNRSSMEFVRGFS
jgi:hypothetical protein